MYNCNNIWKNYHILNNFHYNVKYHHVYNLENHHYHMRVVQLFHKYLLIHQICMLYFHHILIFTTKMDLFIFLLLSCIYYDNITQKKIDTSQIKTQRNKSSNQFTTYVKIVDWFYHVLIDSIVQTNKLKLLHTLKLKQS